METRNALIDEVRLEIEDHGILTAWLMLDYGDGCHQGFGGYGLDEWNEIKQERIPSPLCGRFIANCLKIAGVYKWADIRGKPIRVQVTDGDRIISIGHITKNIWFSPRDLL